MRYIPDFRIRKKSGTSPSLFQNPGDISSFYVLPEMSLPSLRTSYQILFGLDTDGRRPHLLFGINAFSYNPNVPVLDAIKMKSCMLAVQDQLQKVYFPMRVTLQFQGKGGKNV